MPNANKPIRTLDERREDAVQGGQILGEMLASTHATLLKKGLKADDATRITESVVQPMSSFFDGQCGGK